MTQKEQFFLWPRCKTLAVSDFWERGCSDSVEKGLEKLWPNAHPVIFSSARSGLTAVLTSLKLTRPDLVYIPPYSSHCMFESVARIASPTVDPISPVKVAVIYHQWGFVNKTLWSQDVEIIEDCADTMIKPKGQVFVSGGNYAIQSLPKIYGSIFGGVVFCRREEDAVAIRSIRKRRRASHIQTLLRYSSQWSGMAYQYWHGNEALSGSLPTFALNQISRFLSDIDRIYKSREKLIQKIAPEIAEKFELLGRMPSNIPLNISRLSNLSHWDVGQSFISGLRNFNFDGCWSLVAPLPVHLDLCYESLENLIPEIFSEGRLKRELYYI